MGSSRGSIFKAGLLDVRTWLEASHDFPGSRWSPATAPQQEADAEASTETGTKSSQGSSSNTQSAPSEPASAPKEKEAPAEKSKESNSVSIPTLTVTLCQGPFLYLSLLDVPRRSGLSGWGLVLYGQCVPPWENMGSWGGIYVGPSAAL